MKAIVAKDTRKCVLLGESEIIQAANNLLSYSTRSKTVTIDVKSLYETSVFSKSREKVRVFVIESMNHDSFYMIKSSNVPLTQKEIDELLNK